MRDALAFIRTMLFQTLFLGFTVLLLLPTALFFYAVGARRALIACARFWSGAQRVLARLILGIRVEVEGVVPTGAVIVALKHESMFDAVDLPRFLGTPAIYAKEELLALPFWGRIARVYGLISVEREGGARALRSMMAEARRLLDEGRMIAIFPEGTRVAPGESPPLKSGFAAIYKLMGLPVVPVAVRAGHVYRRGFIKYPGTITYRILPAIPPGLPRETVEAKVHAAINSLNHETQQVAQ